MPFLLEMGNPRIKEKVELKAQFITRSIFKCSNGSRRVANEN